MKSLNEVKLIGYVGQNPKLNNSIDLATFSVATTFKTKTGTATTDWHNISAFGKLSEIVMKYIKKGSLIYLSGSLRYGDYEKNGQKIRSTNIIANDIILMPSKNSSDEPQLEQIGNDMPF